MQACGWKRAQPSLEVCRVLVVSGFAQAANEVLHILWLWTCRAPVWSHPRCPATREWDVHACAASLAVCLWLHSELFVCAIWCLCDQQYYMHYDWPMRVELAVLYESDSPGEKRHLVVPLQYVQFSSVSPGCWKWTIVPEHWCKAYNTFNI